MHQVSNPARARRYLDEQGLTCVILNEPICLNRIRLQQQIQPPTNESHNSGNGTHICGQVRKVTRGVVDGVEGVE